MAGGHRTSGIDLLRFGYGVMQDRKAEEEKDTIRKAYGWAAGFDPSQYLADPEKGVKEIVSNLPGDVAYSEVERFNNYIKEQQAQLRAEREQRQLQSITQTPEYGPMRGQYFSPQNPNPAATPERILERLFRTGNPQALEYATKGADLQGKIKGYTAPEDPYKNLESGYRTYVMATGEPVGLPSYRNYQRSVLEQRKAGASRVEVNNELGEAFKLGNPGEGNYWGKDEKGNPRLITPENSPDARAAREAAEKAAGRQRQTARAGTTVIQDLQRALDIVGGNRMAVGAPSLITKLIPESDAQAASGMIESALSNVGLDTLQQMRENSPTGGALGQVPIQQQKRLEQVLGSLDITQRPEIVQDNLKRVINIYMDIVYGEPDQIQDMIDKGEVDLLIGQRLMERHELSFDDFGKPVEKTNKPSLDGWRIVP